jgi:NADPH:quinone reductase-like Zn-dependent oxidoreductase
VAIDVAFAGANYAEILYRRGVVEVPLPFVPGIEVAGYLREDELAARRGVAEQMSHATERRRPSDTGG